jgi:hypothetical protein
MIFSALPAVFKVDRGHTFDTDPESAHYAALVLLFRPGFCGNSV